MAQGFGAPPRPKYWVQVVYLDGRDDLWVPVANRRKPRNLTRKEHEQQLRTIARDAAALWLSQDGVDFVLVLDGVVPEHGIPTEAQMLDEFNRVDDERAADCQVWQLQTAKAKQVARRAS